MDDSARYGYYDSFITMKRWMENRNAGKMLDAYFRARIRDYCHIRCR